MKLRLRGVLKPVQVNEPPDERGLFLAQHAPRFLPRGRVDAAITSILLLKTTNLEVALAARRSVLSGSCRIDAKLVTELYRACPHPLKARLASSNAVELLPPRSFHPIFEDAFARARNASERTDLAMSLDSFLVRNPAERARYRSFILKLMRSREREPSLIGLNLTKHVDELSEEDLAIVKRRLSARFVQHRAAALFAIYNVLRRPKSIHPRTLELCTSDDWLQRIRRIRRTDPDSVVRIYAQQTLEAYDRPIRRLRVS